MPLLSNSVFPMATCASEKKPCRRIRQSRPVPRTCWPAEGVIGFAVNKFFQPRVALAGETIVLDLENISATNYIGGALHFGATAKGCAEVGMGSRAALQRKI